MFDHPNSFTHFIFPLFFPFQVRLGSHHLGLTADKRVEVHWSERERNRRVQKNPEERERETENREREKREREREWEPFQPRSCRLIMAVAILTPCAAGR
jgi:hypothetical protein